MKKAKQLIVLLAMLGAPSLASGVIISQGQFSPSNSVITFETGSTGLPGIPGVQFSGGDASFYGFGPPGLGGQFFGNLNCSTYLDVYFTQPQQAVGAYVFGSATVTAIAFDQSNNIIEVESAPGNGSPPAFLGIGEPSAMIYRVEWRYSSVTCFGVDNINYGTAIGLSQMPYIPVGLAATGNATTVSLGWQPASQVSSYNIKRSPTINGTYSLIGTASGTNYADTNVTSGATYYYAVSGVNVHGESANSQPASAYAVDHFVFAPVPSPQASSVPFSVTITACNSGGATLSNFNGAVFFSAAGDHGNVPVSPSATTGFVNGQWTGMITLDSAYPDTNIRVSCFSNNVSGLSGAFTATIPAIQLFGVSAVDMVYNKSNHLVYGSVPAGAATNARSLICIDPNVGRVVADYALTNDPGKLAVSDNGQFLYIAFHDTNVVRRFNVASNGIDMEVSLGTDDYYTYLNEYAHDLAVLPGKPHSLAVAENTGFGAGAKVVVFDDGVSRPGIAGLYNYSGSVVAASATRFYAAAPFLLLDVDDTGVTNANSPGGLVGLYDMLKYGGGLAFTLGGEVFNPETQNVVGILPACSMLEPDAATGVVYSLSSSAGNWSLNSYGLSNLQTLGNLPLPGVAGSPFSLIRWGTNGLAFSTTANQVYLVRTSLVPRVGPVLQTTVNGTGNGFRFGFEGNYAVSYTIWATTNLSNWAQVGSASPTATNGWFEFRDSSSTNTPKMFYRVQVTQ